MIKSGLAKGKTKSTFKQIKENWGLYLLLLPAVVILICFTYKPMYGIIIAFKDYQPVKGITGSSWANPWYKYFTKFFNSYQFTATIKNTLIINIYSMIISFPLPIILAIAVNQMRALRFKKVFQTITYMPHFISTVVMVGLIMLMLSPDSGILGNLSKFLGIQFPNLMGEAGAFSHIYVLSDVWQHTGWDSIIYIAALSAIDPSLYEAATIDGATNWQKIIYIDLFMLAPTAAILLILRVGGLMGLGFEKVYLMQNTLNIASSEVISTYVYKIGLLSAQYSYSAAIGLFSTIINFILLITVNQISKKTSENSLW
ncbi:ABC transporter permease [Clostridium lacusfryxellense]|uniref:ABC transporter permease n=1 Tax=Clostridium lacusfryxellense TaxID=205328 RepID=UPI001C0BD1FF|nr:ABC transporter permease subunit [Clostridium lacusfryxellense]MBU3114460.1 ABC transporter permease subunit [Clostridium lacusfryxellense]